MSLIPKICVTDRFGWVHSGGAFSLFNCIAGAMDLLRGGGMTKEGGLVNMSPTETVEKSGRRFVRFAENGGVFNRYLTFVLKEKQGEIYARMLEIMKEDIDGLRSDATQELANTLKEVTRF